MRSIAITANASGAVAAAKRGDVVVIVDLIDMSTVAQAFLDMGAKEIFGASPDYAKAPVHLDPVYVGYLCGKKALELETNIIIVTEPRWGTYEERRENAAKAISGIEKSGAKIVKILPNIGAEIGKEYSDEGQVVLLVTDTGGVAFDAALNAGAKAVITGTIARTIKLKGEEPARISADRAIEVSKENNAGITLVAASSNSLEDLLGAQYIANLIINKGFLKL